MHTLYYVLNRQILFVLLNLDTFLIIKRHNKFIYKFCMKSGGTYILGITLLASLFFIVYTIPTELSLPFICTFFYNRSFLNGKSFGMTFPTILSRQVKDGWLGPVLSSYFVRRSWKWDRQFKNGWLLIQGQVYFSYLV